MNTDNVNRSLGKRLCPRQQFGGDEAFMRLALEEARSALDRGDIPVGAVVVRDGIVIGTGSNTKTTDPTAHAEIQAIRTAAAEAGGWNLSECVLYVTLEPCPMCAGACVNARVKRVVFGAYDPRAGAGGTLYNILRDTRLNHRCDVRGGVLSEECASLLTECFKTRRRHPRPAHRCAEQPLSQQEAQPLSQREGESLLE